MKRNVVRVQLSLGGITPSLVTMLRGHLSASCDAEVVHRAFGLYVAVWNWETCRKYRIQARRRSARKCGACGRPFEMHPMNAVLHGLGYGDLPLGRKMLQVAVPDSLLAAVDAVRSVRCENRSDATRVAVGLLAEVVDMKLEGMIVEAADVRGRRCGRCCYPLATREIMASDVLVAAVEPPPLTGAAVPLRCPSPRKGRGGRHVQVESG